MMNHVSLAFGLAVVMALPWHPTGQKSLAQPVLSPPLSPSGELMARTTSDDPETSQCREVPEGDREVGSGSIGSRWTYEIFQRGRSNRFYVLFWRQNDCTEVFNTGIHGTQNDAYQEFRQLAAEQAY